ncbi:hypothetical protein H1D32_10130 [Anaerobacillus sp. CMMVII]|uniref:sensor histidine kinase n=1 Tax=Anaerobacillus sp. CMMVII TaxID=2755588 RepID=UPI0021B77CF5|nr:sensor histidine kinase [Anaerobacillus sp. CMMVII]MCT8138081.1 hypothetical protein [Anaerobacillus sp. CMMVII]
MNVDDLIRDLTNEVRYLAENPIIKDPNSSAEDIKNEFTQFTKHFPYFNDVIFVNVDGIVTVDMLDGVVVGNDFSERGWFLKTKERGVYFSDVYHTPVLNKPILVMAAVVTDEDENIIGIISPAFQIEELWRRIFEHSNLQSRVGINSYAFLFNEEGAIIAHPENNSNFLENYLVRKSIEIQHVNEMVKEKRLCFNEDDQEVSAFSKINTSTSFDHNWYLGVSVSETEFFSPLKSLLYQYFFIFGISLIITTFAIVKLSSYIIVPIEKLISATSDVAVGNKLKHIEVNSYREINKLSEKFNYMIKKVQDREEEHKKSTLILETTDNGIIAINKQTMVITTFNKTCEAIFGVSKENIIHKDIFEVMERYPTINAFLINQI